VQHPTGYAGPRVTGDQERKIKVVCTCGVIR
jgi:hypothetical protein